MRASAHVAMALVEPDVRLTLAPREELVFREAGERGLDLLQELGAEALSLELWMDDQPSDGALGLLLRGLDGIVRRVSGDLRRRFVLVPEADQGKRDLTFRGP